MEITRYKNTERDGIRCAALVGCRVTIKEGAWKGETGTVSYHIKENDALRVVLDSGIQLAWFPSELEKHPTAEMSSGGARDQ